MQIYTAKIYELQAEEEERLYELLDRDRRKKIAALRSGKEKTRSIFAGLLLRYAFLRAGYTMEAWKQAEIESGVYGKPYIKGVSDFHYSLSHSGKWVACATDRVPVGIDLQEMKPWKMTLAKRFYHEKEYERLLALDRASQDKQTEEFYSMWTAKESAVKLNGRGIGAGISQYLTDGDYSHIYDTDHAQMFYTKRYDILGGYMLCVCSRTNFFPDLPERVDWECVHWENINMEENRC